ncbi:glycosyltransferase [Pirellulaceae bacterium]|nr:glycosyltransferase [Pirellulaceae bacterium]
MSVLVINDSKSSLNRRQLLMIGGLAMGILSLASLLGVKAQTPELSNAVRNKSVVFLFQQGGPSQLETFDPKPLAPDSIRTVCDVIPTSIPSVPCQLLNEHQQFDAYLIGLTTRQFSGFAQELRQVIITAGLEDRVNWLGPVPIEEMPRYQRALVLTVAATRYEGFGMVPLEAMACGNAAVASDTGAYRDMIAEGESGFIVPTDDLPALREALNKTLVNPTRLESFGDCGLQCVSEQSTAQREVESIVDVYQQVWNSGESQP